jgi:ABC-2 type transport system ATP-binding protein
MRVVLSTRGLKRAFGKVQAVDGLDLSVQTGEIYGFLGVNGAGKTTAIRMLMGIIKPDAGVIGYVSQEQTFYPWMTCRMLGRFVGGLYPTWDKEEFERLLRVLDLPPDRKSSQLSGGMRVKLALALALAPRPALLILDEPTSGLDPLARREFLNIIRQQAREHRRTTLFSSHIIGEIERVADRVGIIHRGRMCFEGSLDELRASIRLVLEPVRAAGIKPPPLPTPLPTPPTPPPLPLAVSDAPPAIADGPVAAISAMEPPTTVAMSGELPPIISPISPIPANPEQSAPALVPDAARVIGSDAASCTPPPGFEVLQDEVRDGFHARVLRAAAADWESFPSDGVEVQELSIEDIFVALVGKGAIVS